MEKKSPFFRIDERVFITMAVVSIASVIVLGFRYKNFEPCQPIKVAVNTSGLREGSPVRFKAEVKNGEKYEWDFGDGNRQETGSSSIVHIYKSAGKYMVTVTVNDQCAEVQKIYVKEVPLVVNNDLLPKFISPDTAWVNKPITCKDITADAISREWRFGESGMVDATSIEPGYIYKTSGVKTIYLKINGRSDRVAARMIYVKETEENKESAKPQKVKPAAVFKMRRVKKEPESPKLSLPTYQDDLEESVPKAPEVSNEQMAGKLVEMISGENKAEDFSDYLCGDLNVMVVYNGEAMTFLQMCNELKQFKKAKKVNTPQVVLTLDGLTRCIKTMNVSIKKKKLIERIFKKNENQ